MDTRWVRACVTVAAAVLVLAGCGDDDPGTTAADPASGSSESTSEPAESGSTPAETPDETPGEESTSEPVAPLPPCADIWVDDGRKLPAPYLGCSDGGTDVPADARSCSFGKPLVIYGDRFYAVPRGPINETEGPLAKDRDYQGALASCTA